MRTIPALLAASVCGPVLAAEPEQTPPTRSDPTPQEVVITATRVPTPVVDIPAGVSIIDRQTIELRDYNNLVEALSAVPGVRVSPSGGPGGNTSVFVRGTNSNQVLVLRDGMPINDAADSSGAFNFGVDTLSDIERIEVIRGPMAALYGSGAIGGVINLISRRGRLPGVHFEGDLAGGYPEQVRGTVVASGVSGLLDFALIGESQSQRGYDYVPQREAIYTGTPQGYRDRIGTLNLGYTPVPGTRLSVFFRVRQAIFGFNALGSPTFDNANSSGNDISLLGRVGLDSKLFGGTYETAMYLGGQQIDRHYTQPLNQRDPNLATNNSKYFSYRGDFQWNNTVHLSDLLPSGPLSATDLTFGYEYTTDAINVKVSNSFGGLPFSQNARASMVDDAIYLGMQSTLAQRLTVTGQVRQDWVANHAPTTWRLGGVLDVLEVSTRFKAAYGTAFRAPSLFDRFGVDSFGYVGNPNLKPESAQGWEAGFLTTLAAFRRPDFISFGATYFHEQIQDLITAVFFPVNTAINTQSANIQGVEVELILHPLRWLTLQASYTFVDAQADGAIAVANQGTRLLRRPQNSAALNLTATPLPGLTIAPQLTFTGAFKDFLFDNTGNSTSVGTSGQGVLVNVTVTYDINPRLQVYANGTNLFYSKFEPVNGYQTPGPTAVAGIRVRL